MIKKVRRSTFDWYGVAIPNFGLVWRPPYLPYRFRRPWCSMPMQSFISLLQRGCVKGQGLHLILHRTISLTGYIGPLTLHRHSQREAWGLGPPKTLEKNLHNRFSCAKGTNIYVKVLCLVIMSVNVTKYMPQKCQIGQISSSGLPTQIPGYAYEP